MRQAPWEIGASISGHPLLNRRAASRRGFAPDEQGRGRVKLTGKPVRQFGDGQKAWKNRVFFIKVSWIPVRELGLGKIFRKPQSGKSIWTCLGDLCYLDVWWTVQTNSFLQNCVSRCEDGGNPDESCWKTAFFDASQMEIFFLRNSLWARRSAMMVSKMDQSSAYQAATQPREGLWKFGYFQPQTTTTDNDPTLSFNPPI